MAGSRRLGMVWLAGLLLAPAWAQAEGGGWSMDNYSVGIDAGYAKVDLSTPEQHFRDLGLETRQGFLDYLADTGSSGSADYTVKEVSSGIQAGADVLYWMNDTVGFGGRLNLLIPSTMEMETTGTGEYNEEFSYRAKLSAILLSPMVEVCLKNPIGDMVELNFVIAAGAGWSSSTVDYQQHIVDPFYGRDERNSTTAVLEGAGLHLQASANLGVRLMENVALFANAGYNYCNIGEMKYTEDIDTDNDGVSEVYAGDVYGDPDTQKAFNFDFSGVFVGAGVRFSL